MVHNEGSTNLDGWTDATKCIISPASKSIKILWHHVSFQAFHPHKCDVSDEDQVREVFSQIKANHGGTDILVNCAGLAYNAPLLTGDVKHWKHILDVNVIGDHNYISLTKDLGHL